MDRARKRKRRELAREEILAASRKVLLDRGLVGLTLSAVARELNLTKAALYYYFDSKEKLVSELVFRSLERHAGIVGDAIAATSSGVDALEALIRTSADHYGERLDELRLSYLVPQIGTAAARRFDRENLARIRPFNERMYGTVASRIRADQERGEIDPKVDGRRLAFLAHMSVIGTLTIEGLVDAADDAPLIHTREAMVEELVQTFTARLAAPA